MITQSDRDLENQLRRVEQHALNLAEAGFSEPGNPARGCTPLRGSANQARHARLRAVRRELIAARAAERALVLLKRIAILRRMTRG